MKESIIIAAEVYLIGFVISILIAALIKGMHGVIRRISKKQGKDNNESEVSA